MLNKEPFDLDLLVRQVILHEDEQAFKELFYHLVPKLCSYVTYIIGEKGIAEEIAADVMVKFWTKRKQIDPGPRIKNFFFISAKNLAFNFLRDHTKRKFVELESIHSSRFVISENAEDLLVTEELRNVIAKAMGRLPERCKMVFQLVRNDQMSYKEVALLLDVSVKTVENQMGKALLRIRRAIDDYRSEGDNRLRYLNLSVFLLLLIWF